MVRAYSESKLAGRSLKSISELPAELARLPLAHEPGEGWTYGLSHDVLGHIIEIVSGQPLDQFMNDRIFVPLGMTDTSFLVPEVKRDRVATIYTATGGTGGSLTAQPRSYGSATYFSGGGGLFSTARDYSRFAQMLVNAGELDGKRIITRHSIALMTTNQIGKHMVFGIMKYGLGFGLVTVPAPGGKQAVDSYFWAGAYSTNFWVDPRRDIIGIVMTQVVPLSQLPERLAHQAVNKAVEK
jgi:CubicO group peptidase (beta-lactamase class C family)